jgi:hypothetical protein
MKRLIVSFALSVVLGACSRPPHPPSAPPASVDALTLPRIGDTISVDQGYARVYEREDTAYFFHRNGRSFRVVVRKTYLDASAFQAYLDSHQPDSVAYRAVEVVDVTGDGVADSCMTDIRPVDGRPFIEHRVRSGGRDVFFDTLTVDDLGGGEILWGDVASYDALRPYAGVFAATRVFGSFLGGRVDLNEDITREFIARHKAEGGYWTAYLGHFKGHLIWYLNLTDAGLKVWDARSGAFIDFLVP